MTTYCPRPCCDDGRNDAHDHVSGRHPELASLPCVGNYLADAVRAG